MMPTAQTAPPSVLRPGDLAIFLDFDGTLVEFADRPDAVRVRTDLIDELTSLSSACGGALALVTGRDIEVIDRFLAPLVLPVSGVHGAVRREASGSVIESPFDAEKLDRITEQLQQLVQTQTGVFIERKSRSVALHYRQAPHKEAACKEALANAVVGCDAVFIQHGKAVVEVRFGGHDKGAAIASFLKETPFAGRLPVFAGDDITDEDGFRFLNAMAPEAVTIKVGHGPTSARYRVGSVSALRDWLRRLCRPE